MRTSGLYRAVAGSSFRRYATYRVATAAGVFTNTIFGFFMSYTFIALWDQRPDLGGYDQAQALTFAWVGQGLLAATAVIGGGFREELQERIRTGEVSIDLYRPVDLQMWWLSADLGRAVFHLLGRGVVPLAVGALVFELALPSDPLRWLLFGCAVLLALLVSFAINFLVALVAFWLLDGNGLNMVSNLLGMFCSGMVMPLTVFPEQLGTFLQWLPWAALLQVPADVLLGRYSGAGAFAVLLFPLVWAVVLLLLGRAVQAAATRRVVVQGG
ncbi:ABC transporter permease [Streptomyces sp. XC 2026]|uniref:ABC transporter permease n=1 Tax=Streptomyces sp. XC 2026 TaxID=2782004 RepID=UPI001907398F|nr:ABC-2 family transporter protein [Streptomyces sp. XC 2026]QQN78820.1 ABC-2 family transporter protein [Streptomyces sp. XC 2026]